MPNGLPIDIETFRNLKSADAKLDALFDVLAHMNSSGFECGTNREVRLIKCEQRFQRLEARKRFDTTFAGSAGLVGGALVWVLKWMIGK